MHNHRVSDDVGLAAVSGAAAVTGWVLWAQNGLLVLQIVATAVAIVAGVVTIRNQWRKRGP